MIKKTVSELKERFTLRQLIICYKGCVEVRKHLAKCRTLEDIKNTNVLDYDSGLCNMLNSYMSYSCQATYELVEIVQKSWIHTTGSRLRPVKDNPDLNNWEGENLLLRKSLLNHAIYCLELALEKYPSALTKEEVINLKEGKGLVDTYQPEEEPNYFYEGLKRGALTALFVFIITCTIISLLN